MTEHPRATAAAVGAGLTALLLAAPGPHTALTRLADVGSSTDPTGPLVAAVALLAWGVTAWLALTVVLVLLARLPGLVGRVLRPLAGRVAPAAVRRAVEAALGLSVAVGVLAPTTALAAAPPGPAAASVAAAGTDAGWDLDWPSRRQAATRRLDLPRTSPAPVTTRDAAAPASPVPSAVPPRPAAAARSSPAATPLVVRPGDSLWSLAEAALRSAGTAHPSDRQVAQAWPRWWAANREAVGDDPDLLLPGTVLRPPAAVPDRP